MQRKNSGPKITGIVLSVLIALTCLCCPAVAFQFQVNLVQEGGLFSYNIENLETIDSNWFVSSFTILIGAPATVTGIPEGWQVDTDGISYVSWWNTDEELPYPHDIAPGASLSGFEINSAATTAEENIATLTTWDHALDSEGPSGQQPVIVPYVVPEPATAAGLSISLLCCLAIYRKRTKRM